MPNPNAVRTSTGDTRIEARRPRTLGVAMAALALAATLPATAGAQDADPVNAYRLTLQQTSDVRTNTLQRQFYIDQQNAEIARLQESLAQARSGEGAEAELLPLLRDMVARLEATMEGDLPFRVVPRFEALDSLREAVSADDAAVYDGFRRAFDLVEDEVSYGLSVGYYTGNSPIAEESGWRFAACQEDPLSARCGLSREQSEQLNRGATVEDFNQLSQLPDGNYIHYGRLALLYLERDNRAGYRYSRESKSWERLPNGDLLNLRQDVRIARGESAISTMAAPVVVGARPADDAS